MSIDKFLLTLKARGNWGHEGRPGKRGGSLPKGGFTSTLTNDKMPTEEASLISSGKKDGRAVYSNPGNSPLSKLSGLPKASVAEVRNTGGTVQEFAKFDKGGKVYSVTQTKFSNGFETRVTAEVSGRGAIEGSSKGRYDNSEDAYKYAKEDLNKQLGRFSSSEGYKL